MTLNKYLHIFGLNIDLHVVLSKCFGVASLTVGQQPILQLLESGCVCASNVLLYGNRCNYLINNGLRLNINVAY